jgi:hypothetical protein
MRHEQWDPWFVYAVNRRGRPVTEGIEFVLKDRENIDGCFVSLLLEAKTNRVFLGQQENVIQDVCIDGLACHLPGGRYHCGLGSRANRVFFKKNYLWVRVLRCIL